MEQESNKVNKNSEKNTPKEISKYALGYYQPAQNNSNTKLEAFKKRLEAFKNVYTLAEARELLNKSMPVQLERTVFFIGDAKCTIINHHKQIRISLKTPNELISYLFV